jgi:electron transfer flavoprotein beta subunit
MNVVVCVKQIPDPADPGALNPDHTLKRDGKLILDESDSYGVEMALQLVDKAGSGEVTLVSMAPNGEVSGLRTALAMGAAKAILVSDDALKGAGALDTAKVLAAAIKRVEGADLVLAATESSDGYTGTVPEQIAAVLDLPSITFAKSVEIVDGTVKVQRQTEAGYDECEAPLPALVSVTAGVVEPRYPSFKGIMAAKSKPVDTVTVADLGIDAAIVGWAGAGQEIVDVAVAPEPARPARSSKTTAPPPSRSSSSSTASRSSETPTRRKDEDMALSKVWVHAETNENGTVAPITLEMLAKAREIADVVEVFVGGDDAAVAATVGAHGATKVLATGDLSGKLQGVHVAGALAAAIEGGDAPDLIMLGTTYDGRDIAARLSVKLDKPVLTNNVDVEVGDGIVVSTPIFGGTQIVKTKFAAGAPPSPSSAPSRSWPRSPAAAPPRSPPSPCPTPVPPAPPSW